MEKRSRPRFHSGEYFNREDYYLLDGETCHNCPFDDVQRPEQEHYHCLVCHKNLRGSSDLRKTGSLLKRHYNRLSTERMYKGRFYPAHNLRESHRPTATTFQDLSSEDKTLVREGILAFCTAVHNLSWKSQACMSSIMQQVADCNYSSSSAKSAAICKGLFGLEAEQKLKTELRQIDYVAIAFDSSTIHHVKVLPIIATFFDRQQGLQHRLLALIDLKQGGSADCVAWAIEKILRIYRLNHKITAIVADNCPTNFGSCDRQGPNNVFHYLTEKFGNKLIGVGCLAHIVNNALKNSVEKLNFGEKDLNTFLAQVHLYFQNKSSDRVNNIYLIRAQIGFEECYSSSKVPTKSHSKTRWLSTGPAINAIINQWHLFDIYFQQAPTGKHVDSFKEFFNNRNSLPLLITLRSLAADVEKVVGIIEGKEMDLMTAIKVFEDLHTKIVGYRNKVTVPTTVTEMIEHWRENHQLEFYSQLIELYDDIQSYMVKWSSWVNSLKQHSWATLDSELTEEVVINSTETIKENCPTDSAELRQNITAVNSFLNENLEEWNTSHFSTTERWCDLLNSVPDLNALERAASYILTLPGTNATIERLFSEIRHFWNDSKDSMSLATVNTIMKIRYNYERDCHIILPKLISNSNLRRKISENSKYDEAKLEEAHDLVNIMELYGQELNWEEFMWQDLDSDHSSHSSDHSYEDFSSDDDYYDDEDIHQSELDRLTEDQAEIYNTSREVVEMETEEVPEQDRMPTVLECLNHEHNYEGPLEVESPWHR